ncbi:MAG: hypothetical protein Q7U28_09870 [Aquabacterium sp.]|nr:hypothetical protein [Aquabacterium sp.]
MNTLTAALCKKPVIGVAMWLMTLCATNQALHEKYVDLGSSGALLSETFEAPMDEQYSLIFWLRQESADSAAPNWSNTLCSTSAQVAPALSISARVTSIAKGVTTLYSLPIACPRPTHEDGWTLVVGSFKLEAGRYRVELVNGSALLPLKGKRVQVLLRGEGVGFP